MVIEIISVGTEFLMGNIVNSNGAWLSEKCAALGFCPYFQSVVGEHTEKIGIAIDRALDFSDIVIVTSGLGTAQDDLIRETVTKTFGVEGARVIDNPNGIAPGLILQKNGKAVIVLPGTTNEMIPVFEEGVVPFLKSLQQEALYSKLVKLCGVEEGKVVTELRTLITNRSNPSITIYTKAGEVHIRVTAHAKSEEEAKELVKPVVKLIKGHFGKQVYSTDEKETLEEAVVKLLRKMEMTICTAESCTGGLLAARIVNVSGASEVFGQGYVTYANRAKRKLLEVDKNTLKKHGAVSKQTAREMALGAALASGADIGVSITGVAGPDPDEDKPVGLVYIGCYYKDEVLVEEHHFTGNRQAIREQAVSKALELLRRVILEEK